MDGEQRGPAPLLRDSEDLDLRCVRRCAAPACNAMGSEHIVRTEEDSTTQPHVATAARDRKPDWILPHVDSALPVALISDENG